MPVSESRIEVYEKGHRVPFAFRPPLTITSLFHERRRCSGAIRKAGAGGLWGTSNGHRAFYFFSKTKRPKSPRAQKNKGSTAKYARAICG